MKTWFIFNVGGENIGVFTNSAKNGEKIIRSEYGDDIQVEFVDIDWFCDLKFTKLRRGMSPVDCMISSGMIGTFSKAVRSLK